MFNKFASHESWSVYCHYFFFLGINCSVFSITITHINYRSSFCRLILCSSLYTFWFIYVYFLLINTIIKRLGNRCEQNWMNKSIFLHNNLILYWWQCLWWIINHMWPWFSVPNVTIEFFFFFKWDQLFGGDLSCNAFSFVQVARTYGIKGEQLIGPTLLLKLRASWSTWIHRIMVQFGWTSLTTHVEENGSNFLINQYHILFLCFYLEYNWYFFSLNSHLMWTIITLVNIINTNKGITKNNFFFQSKERSF